jgi:hypothetical protein
MEEHNKVDILYKQQEPLSVPHPLCIMGIGGAGGCILARFMAAGPLPAACFAVNTDKHDLARFPDGSRLHIGETLTRGLGAGGNPAVGYKAAVESLEALCAVMTDKKFLLLVAGMGGGTGTGAAAAIAEAAKERGLRTAAVVTYPANFERKRCREIAELGIARLHKITDGVVVVPFGSPRPAGKFTVRQIFDYADTLSRDMALFMVKGWPEYSEHLSARAAEARAALLEAGVESPVPDAFAGSSSYDKLLFFEETLAAVFGKRVAEDRFVFGENDGPLPTGTYGKPVPLPAARRKRKKPVKILPFPKRERKEREAENDA